MTTLASYMPTFGCEAPSVLPWGFAIAFMAWLSFLRKDRE